VLTPEVRLFLAEESLSPQHRADLLFGLLPAESPVLLSRFLTLIIENNRQDELQEILRCFMATANEIAGIGIIELTTAFALSSPLRQQLSDALKARFSLREIIFQETVDPRLKAGIVLTYNGQRLDATLQTRMAQLQQTLHQL
jgi:F-type H+-transporting ATPase subunit delta